MKKFLKYFLIFLGIITLIGLSGFAFIEIRGIPKYDPPTLSMKVDVTPERIERGKKLFLLLCANCHRNQETGKASGMHMIEVPHEFGTLYSANITQDKTYGIGTWTDGELVSLLRTGIKRDGQYAPPYMAKLPNMADEDLYSVIAFLHSDDPLVTASETPDQPCEPAFLPKFLCLVAWEPLKMPEHKIEMPDTNNTVELGKYLVYNLDCFVCHSADFKTIDVVTPEHSVGYLGGGNKPLDKKGNVMLTQNLTPDKATGIGEWTEERFVKALKFGIMENQPALRYPMVPYALLTDTEAKAIYAYLRTVPPIVNAIQRSPFE